jgi:hypothetical protein
METLRDGTFTLTVDTKSLARGLRPYKEGIRNKEYLSKCEGAVGLNGVLYSIGDISSNRINTDLFIKDGFPYPQLFMCKEVILICGKTAIYEFGRSIPALNNVPEGRLWTCIDYGKFIYLSNCTVSIVRDSQSGSYDYSDLETCNAGCDNKGQVIISPC